MKLITEEIESVEVLTETVNGKKTLYIQGPFLQTEVVNRNGRMYRLPVMEREVKRYTEQYVDKGRALGELGHPDGPTVNLDRVSHKIVSLHREGNNFIGKAQILSTPMGKIAESLIKEGVTLGVSSRGIGSVKPNNEGYTEVGEDFMLATAADIVADPSAPDAFVQGIMEGKEWVWEGGILREKLAEQTQRRINTLVDQRKLEEHKLNLFNNFIGKAQLLETPMGKIAKSLIDEGVMLGVSSRGVGSLKLTNEGHKVVGEDFMLATAADIVADPSAPDAFVQGIMEGKEWVWEGGILRERLAEQTQRRINTLVDQKRLEEHKLNLFNEFLSNL